MWELQYRAPTKSTVLRLLEVCVLTTAIISSMFALAYWLGTCVQVPEWVHQSYGFTFHCKGGMPLPTYFAQEKVVLKEKHSWSWLGRAQKHYLSRILVQPPGPVLSHAYLLDVPA
jgi:hypothetical protein